MLLRFRSLLTLFFTVGSFGVFAQYATMDFMETSTPNYEAVLMGNTDLSFEDLDESVLDGIYESNYENGNIAKSITFENNDLNGEAKFYYRNGQLAMNGTFENGKMVGKWDFYTKDGLIASGDWNWRFKVQDNNYTLRGQLAFGLPYGSWTIVSNEKGDISRSQILWDSK